MSTGVKTALVALATVIFAVAAFRGPDYLVAKVVWALLWAAIVWVLTRGFRQGRMRDDVGSDRS